MNRATQKIFLSIAIAIVSTANIAYAQRISTLPKTSTPPPAPATDVKPTDFTLLILGTRYFSDVDVITKNLSTLPRMTRFVKTVSSQKHVKFSGTYLGDDQTLISDIRNLAADRFEVQAKGGRRGLIITLRKITAPHPVAAGDFSPADAEKD